MSVAHPSFAGCDTAGAVSGGDRHVVMDMRERVPDQGTRYFVVGDTPSSLTGVPVRLSSVITGAMVVVEQADAFRAYTADVLVDGVQVATVPIPVAASSASATLSLAVAAGSRLAARLRRTSGSGASAFSGAALTIDLT